MRMLLVFTMIMSLIKAPTVTDLVVTNHGGESAEVNNPEPREIHVFQEPQQNATPDVFNMNGSGSEHEGRKSRSPRKRFFRRNKANKQAAKQS